MTNEPANQEDRALKESILNNFGDLIKIIDLYQIESASFEIGKPEARTKLQYKGVPMRDLTPQAHLYILAVCFSQDIIPTKVKSTGAKIDDPAYDFESHLLLYSSKFLQREGIQGHAWMFGIARRIICQRVKIYANKNTMQRDYQNLFPN